MDTELLASCSSTSTRFLFPWAVRTLRLLDEARDTVTRVEGLGDSFNLREGNTVVRHERMCVRLWIETYLQACRSSPLLLSLQQFAVGVNLHVQSQLHIQ